MHWRVKLCWEAQYSLGIRPHETPTGRQHAADPGLPLRSAALVASFFAFLASFGGVFGARGLYLGPIALNSVIFIDFLAVRGRFMSIFEPSRGAPTLDFARPYGTLATFLENHRFPLGLLLGPS